MKKCRRNNVRNTYLLKKKPKSLKTSSPLDYLGRYSFIEPEPINFQNLGDVSQNKCHKLPLPSFNSCIHA